MIVENNYDECTNSHDNGIKVNLTLDILEGCAHNCVGCYVNKRGNEVDSDLLSNIPKIQKMFNENELRFASLILGPTDIFASNNTLSILKDKSIRDAISNCTTVEMVSTLDIVDEDIIKEFNSIPKHKGFLYGFQVPIDPYNYNIENIKKKIEKLNLFTDPLNFYIVFNMSKDKIDIERISEDIKDELGSLIEFLPSYQRFSKKEVQEDMIGLWKDNLSSYKDSDRSIVSMTIRDKQQGGPYELNYSLYKGKFYSVPFVYDNAIIAKPEFEIKKIDEINSWTDIKTDLYMLGLEYMSQTDDCQDCRRQEICLNKHVLNYMKEYELKKCVYPEWIKNDNY